MSSLRDLKLGLELVTAYCWDVGLRIFHYHSVEGDRVS